MKVIVTLVFDELQKGLDESWIVDATGWKSDRGVRISTGDMKKMLDHALDHTIALMQDDETLTIKLETDR